MQENLPWLSCLRKNTMGSNVVKTIVTLEVFTFVQHEQTCAGDGSVSMGQCAIVGWQKNNQ